MWLSKQLSLQRAAEQEGTAADMGVTTIGGGSAAVMARGEQRELEGFSPGGLIKGGVGCQERCVVAADTAPHTPEGMVPGELFLYSTGGASIYLRADGSIAVTGPVAVEGDLRVTGEVTLTGRVSVDGSLFINGKLCPACGMM